MLKKKKLIYMQVKICRYVPNNLYVCDIHIIVIITISFMPSTLINLYFLTLAIVKHFLFSSNNYYSLKTEVVLYFSYVGTLREWPTIVRRLEFYIN